MEQKSQHSTKRPYEAPTVSKVYIDPIVDMLALCGDPTLGDGKTTQGICDTLSS